MNAVEATLRDAVPEDVERVARFLEPFVEQQLLLPRTTEEIQRLVVHGFVVSCRDQIVGFAAVEVYSRKMAELQCLAVDPAFHGRGLGQLLIRTCVRRAAELGIVELMAITSREQPFAQCGFDFSLPNQKKAMFVHPQEVLDREKDTRDQDRA